MQIDKTRANQENIFFNLTTRVLLHHNQIEKSTAGSTDDNRYGSFSRGHKKVMNLAETHLLQRFATVSDIIEVGLLVSGGK